MRSNSVLDPRSTVVGLIEAPQVRLYDPEGNQWTSSYHDFLGSKQIIIGLLMDAGYRVLLYNLRTEDIGVELGEVSWCDINMRKVAWGGDWRLINPYDCNVWGITSNFYQEREVVCKIISYLSAHRVPIIVGGSDVFAEPKAYIAAGATVAIMDKSGGSNIAALEIALTGKTKHAHWLYLPIKGEVRNGQPLLHPNMWPIPPVKYVAQTFARLPWKDTSQSDIFPMGAVMPDQGCDRDCDFCQTHHYMLGYQYMSVERTLAWCDLQYEAGARSINCFSDQFLGRNIWSKPGQNGRDDIIAIMREIRERGINIMWWNGLETAKATKGRGFPAHRPEHDPTPDRELVCAVWGWDGKSGCGQALIPAERPTEGEVAYRKLLSWQHHKEMLREIVRSGVPDLTYGLIIGLQRDTNKSMEHLLDAVLELRNDLLSINPALIFAVIPSCFIPFPGTNLSKDYWDKRNLLGNDPALFGKWTPITTGGHLSPWEISLWQARFYHEFSPKNYGEKTISSMGGIGSTLRKRLSL